MGVWGGREERGEKGWEEEGWERGMGRSGSILIQQSPPLVHSQRT